MCTNKGALPRRGRPRYLSGFVLFYELSYRARETHILASRPFYSQALTKAAWSPGVFNRGAGGDAQLSHDA